MPSQNEEPSQSRRNFLKTSALASAGAMWIKPAEGQLTQAGQQAQTPPSNQPTQPGSATQRAQARVIGANDRVRVAAIGTGGRCQYLMQIVADRTDTQLVAVCDVYEPNLLEATRYADDTANLYADYRRVLDRPDIDAVIIGAPDHWHARMLIDAVQAGKDVYCEKPMTHRLEEGPQIINAVNSTHRIVQTGTQQRSWPHWLMAGQFINEGMLGTITFAHLYWYQSYGWQPQRRRRPWQQPFDPTRLDRRAWLGNAPDQPVDEEKFSYWRWFWDFGGGALTDLMTHWIDMLQAYIHQPAPLMVTTVGSNFMHPKWQCPDTITCMLQYPGHVNVTYTGTMVSSIDDGGLVMRGTRATLKLDRERLAIYPEDVGNLPHSNAPEPEIYIISEGDGTVDHIANWIDCIRTRKQPNANVQVGMEAARASHLGNLALRRGRPVQWDAATQSVREA